MTGEQWVTNPYFSWMVAVLCMWMLCVSLGSVYAWFRFCELRENNKRSHELLQELILSGIKGISKKIDENTDKSKTNSRHTIHPSQQDDSAPLIECHTVSD